MSLVDGCDAILVPGGFGNRGVEGKVEGKIEGDASSEDAESEKDAAPAAAEEEEPEEPTIQRVEAIEILRDYVRLSRSSSRETLTAELRKPAPDEL